jgi:type IV fimbrial biogenesis protein FimT
MPRTKSTVRSCKPATAGLSVIDLLIGLAVLAIVVLIAVPGSTWLMGHYRLKVVSDDLVSSLFLAKNEALKRASTVRVCPSENGRSCRTDGDWSRGWLVYSDGNGDGKVQDIELLEVFEAPVGHVHIVASGAALKDAGFNATGLVRDNGSAVGEFVVCTDNASAEPKTILIDSDGWVSITSTDGTQPCKAG